MMINKRLLQVCETSVKEIKKTVFFNWVGLICNIIIIWLVGQFINQMIAAEGEIFSQASIWAWLNEFSLVGNLSLIMGILIVIICLAGRLICHHYVAKYAYLASASTRLRLRHLIYEKLLNLGMDYQDHEKTATIVQFTVEGVEQLEIYFGKYLPQFFYAMLAPLTLFLVIATISWQAALVFMLCVPLIPLSIIVIMRIAKHLLKEYWGNYANLGATFLENLQGLTTLKAYSQDQNRHEQMNKEAEKFRQITMKVLSMQLNSINVMDLIAFGGAALGTIFALNQFRNGHLVVGGVITIILLSSEFFIPLRLLGSYFHVAMNGIAASERIFELLDQNETPKLPSKAVGNQDQLKVAFQHVDFSYDGQTTAIKDVSLTLNPGEIVAIVGASGSGKSTIASLLMRQKRATAGQITINDVNLFEIATNELYQLVSFVCAHSHIFKGTIKENLLMAKPKATDADLWQALTLARLADFVHSLPAGLATPILEDGNSLSGGQKQRLAIARVILADRNLLIFDEATSNIDVESEALIWETIYELAKTKTVLVISHRLASVANAQQILVLANGQLVESGTDAQLMATSGIYAKMKTKQQELEAIRKGGH